MILRITCPISLSSHCWFVLWLPLPWLGFKWILHMLPLLYLSLNHLLKFSLSRVSMLCHHHWIPEDNILIVLCDKWRFKDRLGSSVMKTSEFVYTCTSNCSLISPLPHHLTRFSTGQATRIIRQTLWVPSVTWHYSIKAIKLEEAVKSWVEACLQDQAFLTLKAANSGDSINKGLSVSGNLYLKIRACFQSSDLSAEQM